MQGVSAPSALLATHIEGDPLTTTIVRDATLTLMHAAHGANWVQVGEACLSIDPLASQGVQLAVTSGLHGARLAHTTLHGLLSPRLAGQFDTGFLREKYHRHAEIAIGHYRLCAGRDSHEFWKRRAQFGEAGRQPLSPLHAWDGLKFDTRLKVSANVSVSRILMATEDVIEMGEAVVFCDGRRPIAYLGGTAIPPLLSRIETGARPRDILARWPATIPYATRFRNLEWKWEQAILETNGPEGR